MVSCYRETKPDIIFIEGQSSLRNPSGPCGSEFLKSGNVKGVILQHAPGRKYFDGIDYQEAIIPPVEDMPYLLNLITRIGQVEFIDGGVNPPIGEQVDTTRSSAHNESAYQTLFVGNEINTVIPPDAQTGEIFYQLELAPEAAERFSTFDAQKTDAHVCLVIDKEVINCSKVYYWSGNTLDIMPKLSSGTGLGLADLAVLLNSGPLPALLDVSVE